MEQDPSRTTKPPLRRGVVPLHACLSRQVEGEVGLQGLAAWFPSPLFSSRSIPRASSSSLEKVSDDRISFVGSITICQICLHAPLENLA
jgi:hypothetical protein